MAGPRNAGTTGLRAALGLPSATLLVVGSVVGSGIFLTPAIVARHVPNASGIMLVWLVAGLLSLAGALTIAELGGLLPRTGGQYVFLSEAYGRGAAFLFGWMALAVNYSGAIAAIAVAFGTYLGVLAGFSGFAVKAVAIAGIWLLTLVNILGVREGGIVQNVSTVAKVAALAALIGLAFIVGPGGDASDALVRPVAPLVSGFGLALVASLFAFDGLASATFVAGEIRDPARTVPRATIFAAVAVLVVYLLVNGAFLRVLSILELAGNELAAFEVGRAILGRPGGVFVALAIVVATFGTLNAYVLQSPRIYYAMARDGDLYAGFARLHPRFRTPVFGLILQAEWSSLLVLSGTFDALITYVVMSGAVFYALTGIALFVLRRRMPDAPRPYRVPGYPWVPGIFVLSTVLLILNSLAFDTRNALVGLLLALSGVPVYLLLRRHRVPETAS